MEQTLPPDAVSPARARRFVLHVLRDEGLEELADTAELLVSELVTNAVLHARTGVVVKVDVDRSRLRIEVCDENEAAPQRRRYATNATTGRGLMLIETLASRWGTQPEDTGKSVWFEIDRTRATA